MDFHPYAKLFPLIDGEELASLARDIKTHGLQHPIVTYEGKILDGRNRFQACALAGVEPEYEAYQGTDALGYVISLNLHRRHLNESQRAMVAASVANVRQGERTDLAPSADLPKVDQAQAAQLLHVSERSVRSAVKVKDAGIPELAQAVTEGHVSVSAAADIATIPQEAQREIVAKGEKEILAAAKRIRAKKAATQRESRIQKIADISRGNAPLLTDRKYPIIYADPPWRYENPEMGVTDRAAENHYPTMTLEEICAVPVSEIAHEDCVLYLWATAPMLPEGLKVVEAWGFAYRTCFVWVKGKIGQGYHARNQHELLLVGKKGDIPPPATQDRIASVIAAPRAEHSQKPLAFYELIEDMYPELEKIELFCRAPRAGWHAWGNQASAAALPQAS